MAWCNQLRINNMKKSSHISFWVFIALAVILVVFSVQNSGSIPVMLLFKEMRVSLAILLVITFLAGLIAGALYAFVKINPKDKKTDKTNIQSSSIDIDEPTTIED